jgi:hypothetical protein
VPRVPYLHQGAYHEGEEIVLADKTLHYCRHCEELH